MTKNNLMNASRRTALKVAGASAALVAGGVSAAEAATRSGGKRARVTPVTQRPGGQRGGQRGQHGGGQHSGGDPGDPASWRTARRATRSARWRGEFCAGAGSDAL